MLLAVAESWTWAIGTIATMILVLLGWLHIRMKDIASQLRADRASTVRGFSEAKDRIQQVSKEAVAGDAKIYAHLSEYYMQKGEATARMEVIVAEIRGMSKEVAASVKAIGQAAAHVTEQGERIAKVEATCQARHAPQPS